MPPGKIVSSIFRNRVASMHQFAEVYKPSITRQREKLLELVKEKVEKVSKSELARKMRVAKGYYTLEMSPPSLNEMQKLQSDLALVKEFMKTGCYKFLTVKQAWLLFLVGLEITLWFYLGETFGKMHLVGYKV